MTIDLVENLEMTQGGGGIMFFALLWRNVYENRYVIHHLSMSGPISIQDQSIFPVMRLCYAEEPDLTVKTIIYI